MSERRWERLGDLVSNYDALRIPVKSSERIHGPYPYHGASGIVDWVDGFTHEGEHLLVAEDGENLKSRSSPIAFLVNNRFWANNHIHVLAANERSDTRFLTYAVEASDISGYLTGSAQPKLSRRALDSIMLCVPPADVQRAIAEVLGALDDKIAANSAVARSARELSFAHFTRAIRDGFEQVRLREVTTLLARGITPKYSEDLSQSTVVLNQRCVRGQRVDLGPARRTLDARLKQEKLLAPGDVLINSTGQGTLGRVARWVGGASVTVDSHVTIVRVDRDRAHPTLVGFALLRSEPAIESLAEGSTGQTELSRHLLADLEVRIPNGGNAAETAAHMDELSKVEEQSFRESAAVAATRDELLPLLMSGKVRVKDAEKVVEEVT